MITFVMPIFGDSHILHATVRPRSSSLVILCTVEHIMSLIFSHLGFAKAVAELATESTADVYNSISKRSAPNLISKLARKLKEGGVFLVSLNTAMD